MFLPPIKSRKSYTRKSVKTLLNPPKNLGFGSTSIVASQSCLLNPSQLEAFRIVLRRSFKKVSPIWFSPFSFFGFTKKQIDSRMGKGKGRIKIWYCIIKKGAVIATIKAPNLMLLSTIFKVAKKKLPMKARLIRQSLR